MFQKVQSCPLREPNQNEGIELSHPQDHQLQQLNLDYELIFYLIHFLHKVF